MNKKSKLRIMVDIFERNIILKSLHRNKGNITHTTSLLGIDRRNFNKYITKHNISEELEIIKKVYN